MKVMAYVGGYTTGHNAGLWLFESDTQDGSFRPVGQVPNTENAIFLTLNRACTRLYTGQADPKFGDAGKNGVVAAYALDGDQALLLNEQPIGFTPPCYVALDPDESHLAYAEYSNAVFGLFPLDQQGKICPVQKMTVQHTGDGPNKPRQDHAHTHCSVISPDGKYLCIVDLGIDRVKIYDYPAAKRGIVKELTSITFGNKPGAGPRHILFHPNRKLAFVLHELGNTMTSYRYDGNSFEPVQTVPLLPGDFKEYSKASAVKLSADGTQIFGSNRGHESIAAFDLNPETGEMQLKAISKLVGSSPRDFTFFPEEKFALIGHENSNSLMTYAYDKKSGVFSPVGEAFEMFRPVIIQFGAAR